MKRLKNFITGIFSFLNISKRRKRIVFMSVTFVFKSHHRISFLKISLMLCLRYYSNELAFLVHILNEKGHDVWHTVGSKEISVQ